MRQLTKEKFLPPEVPLAIWHTDGLAEYPLHSHDFSELVIVHRGEGIHIVQGIEHPVRAGDVFVINGAQVHGFRHLRSMSHTNLTFLPAALRAVDHARATVPGFQALFAVEPLAAARTVFRSRLQLAPAQLAWVNGIIVELERELRERLPGYDDMVTLLFAQIVLFLSRVYSQIGSATADRYMRIGRVITLLEQDYGSPWTISALAEIANTTPRSLTRQFAGLLGLSPIAFLIRIRINKAATLLQTTALTVTEIAHQVGFNDSNYFTRQFHRINGMSPLAFRHTPNVLSPRTVYSKT
jgi:AraC-like DNA-binding protein